MKVIFLGTNGWFDSGTGNTICTLVKTKSCNIILDAGYGIYKVDRYLEGRNPTYLFLSHLHIDHIAGLHTLAKFKFPQGIKIYTPKSTVCALKKFFSQPFTVPPQMLPFKLSIQAVRQDFFLPGIKVKTLELLHASRCVGYRFEFAENKVIAYCTDTGICPNAIKLARNADLLIAECALKNGQKNESWPHLNPQDAALLAKESGACRLVLTHFDAHAYQNQSERKKAQDYAGKIFPESIAAVDGMELEL